MALQLRRCGAPQSASYFPVLAGFGCGAFYETISNRIGKKEAEMDFKLSKEQELIQKSTREFAEKHIVPVADQIDRENKVPSEIYRKMAELELFGIPFAEEFGGTGAGYSCYPLAVEQIARA